MRISVRKEEAILKFKAVCAECGDDYFDLLDFDIIDLARRYVLIGVECEKAFKYAVDYGWTGLKVIEALQYDFRIQPFI